MKDWHSCEICHYKADRHHICTKGSGGYDEPWNIMYLCRFHHVEFDNLGWVKFADAYPRLRAKIVTAREMMGRTTESRERARV